MVRELASHDFFLNDVHDGIMESPEPSYHLVQNLEECENVEDVEDVINVRTVGAVENGKDVKDLLAVLRTKKRIQKSTWLRYPCWHTLGLLLLLYCGALISINL